MLLTWELADRSLGGQKLLERQTQPLLVICCSGTELFMLVSGLHVAVVLTRKVMHENLARGGGRQV